MSVAMQPASPRHTRQPRTAPVAATPAEAGHPVKLLTGLIATDTNMRSYRIALRDGSIYGTLVWRDFAASSGWQCRLTNDRRTLRVVYARMTDALVEQGSIPRLRAIDLVVSNPEAFADDETGRRSAYGARELA